MNLRVVAAALTVAGSSLVFAQQRLVFHAEANYVEIDAVAQDKDGHFVSGLTAADFAIREAKVPQQIDSFTYVELPVAGHPAPAVPIAPARINPELHVAPGSLDGRVYLIFLDPQSQPGPVRAGAVTSSSFGTLDVRKRAREFVTGFLQPGDLAAVSNTVIHTADLTFTTNRGQLLQMIDGRSASKVTGSPTDQMLQLKAAVDLLGGVQGRRKSLLLFTEGLPVLTTYHRNSRTGKIVPEVRSWFSGLDPGSQYVPGSPALADEFDDLNQIDITGRADVHIYTIDTRGLVAPGSSATGQYRNGPDPAGPDEIAGQISAEYDALSASTMDLHTIADSTGGLSFINSNDFKKGFTEIVDDNSRYYVLGYYSSNTTRDGRFVPVDVTTTRPGLVIRARKGYVAK